MRLLICCAIALLCRFPAVCQSVPGAAARIFSSRTVPLDDTLTVGHFRVNPNAGGCGTEVHIYGPKKTIYPLGTVLQGASLPELEFRLLNGTPVVAILPVSSWKQRGRGKKDADTVLHGRFLHIKGLGYGVIGMPASYIDTLIDARLPDAYAIARQLADSSYRVPERRGKK
jgi:hypothetical protein